MRSRPRMRRAAAAAGKWNRFSTSAAAAMTVAYLPWGGCVLADSGGASVDSCALRGACHSARGSEAVSSEERARHDASVAAASSAREGLRGSRRALGRSEAWRHVGHHARGSWGVSHRRVLGDTRASLTPPVLRSSYEQARETQGLAVRPPFEGRFGARDPRSLASVRGVSPTVSKASSQNSDTNSAFETHRVRVSRSGGRMGIGTSRRPRRLA